MKTADPLALLRRRTYVLLIVVAGAMATGRLASAMRLYEPVTHRPDGAVGDPRPGWPAKRPDPWPTFRSNDRSRWAAVHALVDHGTWVIGRRDRGVVLASGPAALAAGDPLQAAVLLEAGYDARIHSDTGLVTQEGFSTVDKVLHPTRLEYYSSKPPLLTLMVAGEYWLLQKLFGWSIVDDRWLVIRVILFTINVLPLALYLFLLSRLVERFGTTDWGRLFVVAAAAFATIVTPFLISFNNHTPGTFSVLFALYLAVRILERESPSSPLLGETPLSPSPLMGEGRGGGERTTPHPNPPPQGGREQESSLPQVGREKERTPPSGERGQVVLFVLAGLCAGFAAVCELPAAAFTAGLFLVLLWRRPRPTLLLFAPAAALTPIALLVANYLELGQLQPAYGEIKTPWYQYEGSHWRPIPGQVKRGIDSAREYESRAVYAFHVLLGHHGFFSMTPIHFLAVAGMLLGLRRWWRNRWRPEAGPVLAVGTLAVSLVVIGFYLVMSDNYGGWSNGLRWLMWLTPLWLLTMLPVVDRLGRGPWGRALCLTLLALSILSAHYADWTPWHHPWIYDWMDARGLIPY